MSIPGGNLHAPVMVGLGKKKARKGEIELDWRERDIFILSFFLSMAWFVRMDRKEGACV